MSDTGWKNPGTAVNDSSVGTISWDNNKSTPTGSVSNVLSSDNETIGFFRSGEAYSHYIKVSNFSFDIPSATSITGVEVSVECFSTFLARTFDNGAYIVKGGTISGEDKSKATNWSDTEETRVYGGSTDMWNVSLVPSDVNSSTFGFVISVGGILGALYADIDNIQMKVYYTLDTPIVDSKYPLPAFKIS